MHSLGQRARFVPKLPRPPRCALKGMILSWTQDPPVCRDILYVDRDILEVFPEVSPGCHLTVMMSLWVSWFSEQLMLDVQNYSVELKQIGEFKDKSSILT